MDSNYKSISDRIYKIIRIEMPSAQEHLAAGEKHSFNPVNPVKKKKLRCSLVSVCLGGNFSGSSGLCFTYIDQLKTALGK